MHNDSNFACLTDLSGCASFLDIQNHLKARLCREGCACCPAVVGIGYDAAALAEKQQPCTRMLDEVSRDCPILVLTADGCGAAANTALRHLLEKSC